ncbi:hypothetical protein NECID01_1223 [Nematocida sp. AWRm77]|nr:hypothetical protein NECID01_1223 [Nematocida sp. AWRm77]
MTLIAAGGCQGAVLWNPSTGTKLDVPFEHDITCMVFQEATLICAAWDLYVYDVVTGVQVGTLSGHTKPVTSSFFSSGVLYTTSEDGTVRGWDVRQRKCVKLLESARGGVYSAAVHGGALYYTDYHGFVHKGESGTKKQISNCSVSLSSTPDGLFGYDRRGRLHRIESDLSAEVGLGVNKIGHYGIKCVSSGEYIGVCSSNGVGLIRKAEKTNKDSDMFCNPEFHETSKWVWDIDFARGPEDSTRQAGEKQSSTLYFVGTDGALSQVSQGMSSPQTVFSVEYPLKAVRVSSMH